MTTRTEPGVGRLYEGRTDVEYALVAGFYAALSLSPLLGVGLSALDAGVAMSYLGFLGAVAVVVAIVGSCSARTPGLAVGIGRRDASWLLAALPIGWFLGAFGGTAVGVEPPDLVVALSVLAAGVGGLLGTLLVTMSRIRHAAAMLAGADEYARWEARWPRRWRRIALGLAVASFVVSGVGVVADLVFGVERAFDLYIVSVFGPSVAAGLFNHRTIRATDAGLVVEHPVARHLRPWSSVESYTLTEEALVIRWVAPWRPTLRCDRADVENVEAAAAALDSALSP